MQGSVAGSPIIVAVKRRKKRGMTFVGSTIIYSYLQAVGIINDHQLDCDFRGELCHLKKQKNI